jgi:hypothetical protein
MVAVRHSEIVKLNLAGHSVTDIAGRLGYSRSTVQSVIKKACKRTLDEAGASQIRATSLARYDAILAMLWPRMVTVKQPGPDDPPDEVIEEVNLPVMDRVAKIIEAQRKLTGADLPIKLRVDGEKSHKFGRDATKTAAQLQRLMGYMDRAADKGLGSGRHDDRTAEIRAEGEAAGIRMVGGRGGDEEGDVDPEVDDDIEEAEIVEPVGQWIDGRFVPDDLPAVAVANVTAADLAGRIAAGAFRVWCPQSPIPTRAATAVTVSWPTTTSPPRPSSSR